MNSKLISKAFLGIRFGKSPVEKAYENDREIALAAAYGDLMNDKKARKWAEKDYDKKWANSSNRKNFQYGYQVTDLDNKLAQLRAENDKIVSDFTKTVNHNYDIFNPNRSKVEDAVDWLAIGAQQMPKRQSNAPRRPYIPPFNTESEARLEAARNGSWVPPLTAKQEAVLAASRNESQAPVKVTSYNTGSISDQNNTFINPFIVPRRSDFFDYDNNKYYDLITYSRHLLNK